MVPVAFDEENAILDPPKGMKQEDCESISICTAMYGKVAVVISCWKLTTDELEEVNRTGRIYVMVMGTTMPPICPVGISPF